MTQAFLDCTCPAGHAANVGAHHPECSHANIDANLVCSCCPQDHDHAAAANSCPGGHSDPCPEPRTCRTWRGVTADLRHPDEATRRVAAEALGVSGETGPGDCPGGHCHKDLPGCTVCRPLVITMVPGSADITPAGV